MTEAELNFEQMERNAEFANRYESALWDIAKLCGWEPKPCTGSPVDADVVALELVRKLVENKACDCKGSGLKD